MSRKRRTRRLLRSRPSQEKRTTFREILTGRVDYRSKERAKEVLAAAGLRFMSWTRVSENDFNVKAVPTHGPSHVVSSNGKTLDDAVDGLVASVRFLESSGRSRRKTRV